MSAFCRCLKHHCILICKEALRVVYMAVLKSEAVFLFVCNPSMNEP
jgi:hypothetical protein